MGIECVKSGIIFVKYRWHNLPQQHVLQDRPRWVVLAKEWLIDADHRKTR